MNSEPGHPGHNDPHTASTANDKEASRRSFLFKVGIALNALVGLAVATPIVGYLLGPVRRKGGYDSWIELGKVSDFRQGETVLATYRNPYTHPWDGDTAKVACYVRRAGPAEFTIFAVNCAHLGCPVRWFPQSELFMCPCHGGVYYANGDRAAGPPERGLWKYEYRVNGNSLKIHAGQMPTLANEAKLVKGILPCPGSSKPSIG